MHKIGYTIDEVSKLVPIGKTKLYEAINTRALRARKYGRRTLILHQDLTAWLDTLPALGQDEQPPADLARRAA